MPGPSTQSCIAFEGERCVASGPLPDVARLVKAVVDRGGQGSILVFDETSSQAVELDLRGTPEEVQDRYRMPVADASDRGSTDEAGEREQEQPKRGPGRPRLGVVSREVTLLPRHWAWLGSQRGGASAALRRLVEQARKASEGSDLVRRAQDATYRFISAIAGDRAGYEEALRALYAGDREGFETRSAIWPDDVRDHARRLSEGAFRDL
jgi:hypothetical protein